MTTQISVTTTTKNMKRIPRPVLNYAPVFTASDKDIGYLAGIIDGEGSIYMTKFTHPSGRIEMHLKVEISNTSTKLMDWLKDHFGTLSAFYQEKRAGPAYRKECYHAVITEIGSVHSIISAVKDQLVIKKPQAELVLRYTGRRLGLSKYHTPYNDEDKEIYEKLRALNRRCKEVS